MEAMRLLDGIALEGVRFPAALLVFRKACFTLDGVLQDVAGSSVRLDSAMARYAAAHPLETAATLVWLLTTRDWLSLNWSAATMAARVSGRAALRPWSWLPRVLPPVPDSDPMRSPVDVSAVTA